MSLMSGLMKSAATQPNSMLTTSPVTLSLARRFNSTGSSNVLKFDQARARELRRKGQARGGGVDQGDSDPSGNLYDVEATSQVVSYVVTVSSDVF